MKKKIKKTHSLARRTGATDLFQSVTMLIEQSKQRVLVAVNTELVTLYWNIGRNIRKNILQNKRAEYGKQIISTLSGQLTKNYGIGWGEKQLNHCLRSAETFSQQQIHYAVRRQLSWTHLRTIMYEENELKREFYFEMCILERWSTRLLQERIDSMLFERTVISKKPAALIKKELSTLRTTEKISPDLIFRDPYFLDFLGLKDTYSEKDLESAILAELQRFITELGSDFAFLARQRRIQIDNQDYSIDLLFYHRKLCRLVAIDLKLGKFRPADKAQMELYLNWLNKHERKENEETPIGLILCADKADEHIELLELDKGNIRVAQYYTELPPKKLLQQKLHKAWLAASEKYPPAKKYSDKK
jgi:predicted nuclease of restriction endonuclease-like (RecB) superfamily